MATTAKPVQLPSGHWQIRWLDEKHERHSATFKAHNDAQRVLAAKQTEVDAILTGRAAARPPRKTFDQIDERWLVRLGGPTKDQRSHLRKYLRPAFSGMALTDISFDLIEEFKADIEELAASTIRNILNTLSGMFQYARKLGWIRADQIPDIERPSVKANGKDFRYLRTKDEINRFLKAARDEGDDAYTMYAMALLTGMRQGELAALTWDKVHLETTTIAVDQSFRKCTKTGNVRYVLIVNELLPILRAWRLRSPGPLLFPTVNGTMHQSCDRIFVERYHRALDAAGFQRPTSGRRKHYICFHDLRHTFASHWMMSRGCIFKLQRLLGHQSTDQTQRYAHLSPEAFDTDLGRFGGLITASEGDVLPAARPRRGLVAA